MALRQLSVQERAEARRKALQARQARAELKAAFAAGEVGLADIFARADAEDAVARLRTVDLLLALPGVGGIRAREAMAAGVLDNVAAFLDRGELVTPIVAEGS